MTVNPKMRKTSGEWFMDWIADPAASAYEVITPAGAHVQAGKGATSIKFGVLTEPFPMPKIAPAIGVAFETPPNPFPAQTLTVTQTITDGQVLTAPVSWNAMPSAAVQKVEFFIDDVLAWTESFAPYVFNGDGKFLDPSTLAPGAHKLKVVATNPTSAASIQASVTVQATTPTPPPPSSGVAGRVGTYPDMSGKWLDASAQNASQHGLWNDLFDRVLHYGTFANVTGWYDGGHGYNDAYAIYKDRTNPPEIMACILQYKDAAGTKQPVFISWRDTDGQIRQYAADVGNQVWRDAFVARCKDELAKGGKGIYWDDFNLPFRFWNAAGQTVIPIDPRTNAPMTQDNWAKYMVEFAEYVAAKVPAEHCFNTIWYFGDHTGTDQWQQRLARIPGAIISYERGFIDGGLHGNLNVADEWSFGRYLQHMDNMHAAGAAIYTRSYASTEAQALFNLVATLLISNGRDFQGCRYGMVPTAWWQPHNTNLGADKGPRYSTGTNKLRRDFEKGWIEGDFAARTGRIVVT